jgi:DNA-binding transcriptional ArsR family regulator
MIFNNTGIIEIVMTAKLNERQKFILSHLLIAKRSVSQIADLMNDASRATLNRDLLKLESLGLIYKEGRARATLYVLNKSSALLLPIDPDLYFADDIDERKIITNFNMDIFETLNSVPTFFSESELQYLK